MLELIGLRSLVASSTWIRHRRSCSFPPSGGSMRLYARLPFFNGMNLKDGFVKSVDRREPFVHVPGVLQSVIKGFVPMCK